MVYLENNNHQDARELCIKYGKSDSDLWRKAISAWAIRADDETIVNELKLALVHASEVLSVLTLIALLRDCEGPLSLIKDLVLKKIEADNQEIKVAEERIAKLSKTMQIQKRKLQNY